MGRAWVQDARSATHRQVFPGAKRLPLSPTDQLGNRVFLIQHQGSYCSQAVFNLYCCSLSLRSPWMRALHLFTGQYPRSGTNGQKRFEWNPSLGHLRSSLWVNYTRWGWPSPFLYKAQGPLVTITSANRKQFSIKEKKVILAKTDIFPDLLPCSHSALIHPDECQLSCIHLEVEALGDQVFPGNKGTRPPFEPTTSLSSG